MSTSFHSRRHFLRTMGGAALVVPAAATFGPPGTNKTHFVTLSFDDGFRNSSIKTAEIFEKYDLSACINVIATAHRPEFAVPNEYHAHPVGDFGLWNELKQRGHEIMPHGYMHANLLETPPDRAKDLVLRCLDNFSRELEGFEPSEAIFNFPYNASGPEIENWVLRHVRAYRTGYDAINPVPYSGQSRLTCTSHGPQNIDMHLTGEIETLLSLPSGWLIYNAHGLDDEGWGPLSAAVLDGLLDRLTRLEHVQVMPAGMALSVV